MPGKGILAPLVIAGVFFFTSLSAGADDKAGPAAPQVHSLDGSWLLSPDPDNVGREEQWFHGPAADAQETKVPWVMQDTLPGYHGVAWYWREFDAPAHPSRDDRYLLRFHAVDYLGEVWVNDQYVGMHEGAEEPFVLDITEAVKAGQVNRLAVRVLNPVEDRRIDGFKLQETPHRVKEKFFNIGGITDSVELLLTPAVWIEDLYVYPDPFSGVVQIEMNVRNAGSDCAAADIQCSIGTGRNGITTGKISLKQELPAGDSLIQAQLKVDNPRLWELNDPYLYRVTCRVQAENAEMFDERSRQCGFRDFRLENGYFRLNGKRTFIRSAHTGNESPITIYFPHDKDYFRRDLLNVKVMGLNAIRFIAGVARPYQLDLCDEMGLMVYEECMAAWYLEDSPFMEERFDNTTLGMIKRDRSHPCIIMWGLMNENFAGEVFFHALNFLPQLRAADNNRLVILNSGRHDGLTGETTFAGVHLWRMANSPELNISFNPGTKVITCKGSTWQPGQVAFHPGLNGEYTVMRWKAPADGSCDIVADLEGIAKPQTTSDIHIYHNSESLFDGLLNIDGHANTAHYQGQAKVRKGDKIDVVVGIGNDVPFGVTTALKMTITGPDGKVYDAAADFTTDRNPNGCWQYGWLKPDKIPNLNTFSLYDQKEPKYGVTIGTVSNPGMLEWQDILSDRHPYPQAPHTASTIQYLRTIDGGKPPLFLSEYGVGSTINLARMMRFYEQFRSTHAGDYTFYHEKYEKFLLDWDAWKLADTFGRPDDFFQQEINMMGQLRLFGINALRANPNVIGYSLTGAVDQGFSGEGLVTTFRELKPGTVDALFDGLAPLRWCLFAEPITAYKDKPILLEAVLANEDVLSPGQYEAELMVLGPDQKRYFQRDIPVTIPEAKNGMEPSYTLPVFSEEVRIDGPEGEYRLVAAFKEKAAAAGGQAKFYLFDRRNMPPVEPEVVLWGEDTELRDWLADIGITVRSFDSAVQPGRELILVSSKPYANGRREEFRELARRIGQGSAAVFLSPKVFFKRFDWFGWPDKPLGWLPLKEKGEVITLMNIGLYHADRWLKRNPIFDGLPCGGMMDYFVYRNIAANDAYAGIDGPDEAIAGGNFVVFAEYKSGLQLAEYRFGAGRFILNTLSIRENLGTDPVAEKILRNLLRYAGRDVNQPLAPLPDDFSQQLIEIGY